MHSGAQLPGSYGWHRWALGLGVTAVALAISAATSARAAPPPPPSPPQWRFVASPSPAYGVLTSVTAPAKNAAWAVGLAGKVTTKPFTGYFLTWNGRSWRQHRVPVAGFQPMVVASSSPSDVWMFGSTSPTSADKDEALRWNGHHWLRVPMPFVGYLDSAVVLGPRDVWVYNYHWNGRTWTKYAVPRGFTWTETVGVRGRNNIWAIGMTGKRQHATAYRQVDGSWRQASLPRAAGFADFGVAESARNVYISIATHSDGLSNVVLHWNGRRWRTLPAPPIPGLIGPVGAATGGGLWDSQADLWNGHKWQDVYGPGGVIPTSGNAIVAIPGTRSAWMVGNWCTGATCRRHVMINGKLP